MCLVVTQDWLRQNSPVSKDYTDRKEAAIGNTSSDAMNSDALGLLYSHFRWESDMHACIHTYLR